MIRPRRSGGPLWCFTAWVAFTAGQALRLSPVGVAGPGELHPSGVIAPASSGTARKAHFGMAAQLTSDNRGSDSGGSMGNIADLFALEHGTHAGSTRAPTPHVWPTPRPTPRPTWAPTPHPTHAPTRAPTSNPTAVPTPNPTPHCPAGKFRSPAKRTTQSKMVISGVALFSCLDCPASKWSAGHGLPCRWCPSGRWNLGAAIAEHTCAPCDAGKFRSNDRGHHGRARVQCGKCSAGRFAAGTGSSQCHNCPPGKYQPSIGWASCLPCAKGRAQANTGRTSCDKCSHGRFMNERGASICAELPPTMAPSPRPTPKPTSVPTSYPTPVPPTPKPTKGPTLAPTATPTAAPSAAPTQSPTVAPTAVPTQVPTLSPTALPTTQPTPRPTHYPTRLPTAAPTKMPTPLPTLSCPAGRFFFDVPDDGPHVSEYLRRYHHIGRGCARCPNGKYAASGSSACAACPAGRGGRRDTRRRLVPEDRAKHLQSSSNQVMRPAVSQFVHSSTHFHSYYAKLKSGAPKTATWSSTTTPKGPSQRQDTWLTPYPTPKPRRQERGPNNYLLAKREYLKSVQVGHTLTKDHDDDDSPLATTKIATPHFPRASGTTTAATRKLTTQAPNKWAFLTAPPTPEPTPMPTTSPTPAPTPVRSMSWSEALEDACVQCAIGLYAPAPGTSACLRCAKGKFGTVISSKSEGDCVLCEAGRYSVREGARDCAGTCPPGRFSVRGSWFCVTCGWGTYSAVAGAAKCRSCPAGKMSHARGADAATGGEGLTVHDGIGASEGAAVAAAIEATDADMLASCADCPRGTWSNPRASSCSASITRPPTPVPSRAPTSKPTPAPTLPPTPVPTPRCQPGQVHHPPRFVRIVGDLRASAVGSGAGGGEWTCEGIGRGIAVDGDVARPTQAHVSANVQEAPAVPPGLSCCVACRAGRYSTNTDENGVRAGFGETGTRCAPCQPGRWSMGAGTDSTVCIPCAENTFAPRYGSALCAPCPAGKYSYGGLPGSVSCLTRLVQPDVVAMPASGNVQAQVATSAIAGSNEPYGHKLAGDTKSSVWGALNSTLWASLNSRDTDTRLRSWVFLGICGTVLLAALSFGAVSALNRQNPTYTGKRDDSGRSEFTGASAAYQSGGETHVYGTDFGTDAPEAYRYTHVHDSGSQLRPDLAFQMRQMPHLRAHELDAALESYDASHSDEGSRSTHSTQAAAAFLSASRDYHSRQQREQRQRLRRNQQQQGHAKLSVPIPPLQTQLPARAQGAPATRSAPSLSPAETFIQNARLNADRARMRGDGCAVDKSAAESANAAAAAFIAASRRHYDNAAAEDMQSAPTHVQLSRHTGQQDVNFFV